MPGIFPMLVEGQEPFASLIGWPFNERLRKYVLYRYAFPTKTLVELGTQVAAARNRIHQGSTKGLLSRCSHIKITMKPYLFLIALLLSSRGWPQSPAEWHDELIEHLAGSWKLEGKLTTSVAHHDVRADWVLNHQFLRIAETTSPDAPPEEPRYEAVWYLGYDPVSERYVLHLMDVFGTRFSETLGYGVRDGNDIRFVFEYPDGPFHNTYRWNSREKSWQWVMEQKNKDGKWVFFADLKLLRAATGQE